MAGLFDAAFRRRLAGGTDRQSMAVVSPVIGVALISARFLPARTSCGYRGVTSRGRAMLSGSVMSGWAVLTRWSEGWSASDPATADPVTTGPGAVTAGPKCLVGGHNAPCVAKRGTVSYHGLGSILRATGNAGCSASGGRFGFLVWIVSGSRRECALGGR